MRKKSLYADLDERFGNPRTTEMSSLVIEKWGMSDDPYVVEFPEVSEGNFTQVNAYYSITAERILLRARILNLDVDDRFLKNENVLATHPLGNDGPSMSELLNPSVTIAMAFIPLVHKQKAPILVRCYCVKGLKRVSHVKAFDSALPEGAGQFDWYLVGYGQQMKPKDVSWHLAAHLMMHGLMLSTSEGFSFRRNLASKWVVTGTVGSHGEIQGVSIGRKVELAVDSGKLKWIVPIQNKEETQMINAEYPATKEDAIARIKEDQNRATRLLQKAVSAGVAREEVWDEIMEALKMDADATTLNETGRMNSLQLFAAKSDEDKYKVLDRIGDSLVEHGLSDNDVGEMFSVLARKAKTEDSFSYYGGFAQTFFTLARFGMEQAIRELSKRVDINATDRNGMTALDFAIENEQSFAANILMRCGANRRGVYSVFSGKMQDLIFRLWNKYDITSKDREFLQEALDNKLDPNEAFFVDCPAMWQIRSEPPKRLISDPTFLPMEEDYEYYVKERRFISVNLYLAACVSKDEGVIELCKAHGADDNLMVRSVVCTKVSKREYSASEKSDEDLHPIFTNKDFENKDEYFRVGSVK